jgi:hypothetical protein
MAHLAEPMTSGYPNRYLVEQIILYDMLLGDSNDTARFARLTGSPPANNDARFVLFAV